MPKNWTIHPGLFFRYSGMIILMVLVIKYRPEHRVEIKESLARILKRSSVVWNVLVMYLKLLKLVMIPRPEMPEKRYEYHLVSGMIPHYYSAFVE